VHWTVPTPLQHVRLAGGWWLVLIWSCWLVADKPNEQGVNRLSSSVSSLNIV
jgi:hypothetical protein